MTKTIGGGIRDPSQTPIQNAEVAVEINGQVHQVTDESSIARAIIVHTDINGVWSVDVVPNDRLTPMHSRYRIHETYPNGGGYKVYYVNVSSNLPGGINQVLDLLENNPPQIGGEMAVIADGVDGSILATVKSLTNSKALAVEIVDGSGNQITSFGGGTQYTEDAVAAADPVGTSTILVRKDTPAATVSADGDNIAWRGGNFGNAYVTLVDSGGNFQSVGGGTQYTEDAAAAADPVGNAINLVRKDAPAATVSADGDNIALRGSNFGALYATLLNSSGVIIDGANPLAVSGAVTVSGSVSISQLPSAATLADAFTNPSTTHIATDNMMYNGTTWDRMRGDTTNGLDVDVTRVSGTVTVANTTLEGAVRAEDAASADGHTGIGALAVRKATPADTSGADGDYEFLQMKSGRLWASATIDAALPAGNNNIGDVDIVSLPASTNTLEVVGDVAEDAALAGNPVRVGVRASTAVPTAMSADGDVVTPWADRSGAIVVIPQPRGAKPSATPTIATSGYVAGDRVGSLMTFSNAALATARMTQIVQARLTCRTATAKNDLNLWLFETSPTIASADNAALDITGANLESANLIGVVQFLASDYYDTANSCACNASLNKGPVTLFGSPTAGADIFGVLEMGATVAAQYAGTTDIVVTLWTNPY